MKFDITTISVLSVGVVLFTLTGCAAPHQPAPASAGTDTHGGAEYSVGMRMGLIGSGDSKHACETDGISCATSGSSDIDNPVSTSLLIAERSPNSLLESNFALTQLSLDGMQAAGLGMEVYWTPGPLYVGGGMGYYRPTSIAYGYTDAPRYGLGLELGAGVMFRDPNAPTQIGIGIHRSMISWEEREQNSHIEQLKTNHTELVFRLLIDL